MSLHEILYDYFIDPLIRMVHGQRDSEGLKASFNSIKFCERVILLIEGLQVG